MYVIYTIILENNAIRYPIENYEDNLRELHLGEGSQIFSRHLSYQALFIEEWYTMKAIAFGLLFINMLLIAL